MTKVKLAFRESLDGQRATVPGSTHHEYNTTSAGKLSDFFDKAERSGYIGGVRVRTIRLVFRSRLF